MSSLPTLVEKSLTDAGYDVIGDLANGWIRASVSGDSASDVRVRVQPAGIAVAMREPGLAQRIGLVNTPMECPGMASAGLASTAEALHRALRLLRTLDSHPIPRLSAEVEARLARIPATERTREVRERIGQEVFREALMEFWGGRCALSGVELPAELLRASHAKPWRDANDVERLDPFNGLLLAVRFDALFDKGLIAFDDEGRLLASDSLTPGVCEFVGLQRKLRLRFVVPGHLVYLRYHREHVARL